MVVRTGTYTQEHTKTHTQTQAETHNDTHRNKAHHDKYRCTGTHRNMQTQKKTYPYKYTQRHTYIERHTKHIEINTGANMYTILSGLENEL